MISNEQCSNDYKELKEQNNAMQNKTVIVIAYRLSTVKAMDRILGFQ